MAPADGVQGKTVLVTGARGFIGQSLTRRLVESGAVVHAVAGRRPGLRPAGPVWHEVDLEDRSATLAVVALVRPDVVYHLAGFVSGIRELQAVGPSLAGNLLTTVHVLEAVTELRRGRVVLASSLEEPEPGGAAWPVPSSPYAASKYAASTYARMFHALYGTAVVFLRTFMVYGPAQPDQKKVIPYVTRALLREQAPSLASGTRAVDWVFVEDVVDAYVAAGVAPGIEGKDFDVGSGSLVTVREIVEELVRIIGPKVRPSFGSLSDRPMEQVRVADLEATREALGFSPRTTLAEGLGRVVAFYREELERETAGART